MVVVTPARLTMRHSSASPSETGGFLCVGFDMPTAKQRDRSASLCRGRRVFEIVESPLPLGHDLLSALARGVPFVLLREESLIAVEVDLVGIFPGSVYRTQSLDQPVTSQFLQHTAVIPGDVLAPPVARGRRSLGLQPWLDCPQDFRWRVRPVNFERVEVVKIQVHLLCQIAAVESMAVKVDFPDRLPLRNERKTLTEWTVGLR